MFRCFRTLNGVIALAAAILLGGYLVIWHGAHLAAALPFIVLLACPLMHFFMHRGHGHQHGRGPPDEGPPAPPNPSRSTSTEGD